MKTYPFFVVRRAPDEPRRKFNYNMSQQLLSIAFLHKFLFILSHFLYFTNKKLFAIIYLQGKEKKTTQEEIKKWK